MKIITFEDNSQFDKSLGIVLDLALKAAGMQANGHVNFILSSIQNVPEQQVVVPEVAASQPETQAEPVIEP